MNIPLELTWHTDGHFIDLSLNKQEIKVTSPACPHGEKKDSPCFHEGVSGCLVKHFVNVYGLETNTGSCELAPRIEIAWCSDGSTWDIDMVRFFMIPVSDPAFSDWLKTQTIPD